MNTVTELYAYMTTDEEGNEVLLGTQVAGLWIPLTFRTSADMDVLAPFAQKVSDSTGREVFVKRFVRQQPADGQQVEGQT